MVFCFFKDWNLTAKHYYTLTDELDRNTCNFFCFFCHDYVFDHQKLIHAIDVYCQELKQRLIIFACSSLLRISKFFLTILPARFFISGLISNAGGIWMPLQKSCESQKMKKIFPLIWWEWPLIHYFIEWKYYKKVIIHPFDFIDYTQRKNIET